jgi:hypothetical protein
MNAQHVWMAQATQAPRISLEYIRHRANNLERGTRKRAAINYVIVALVYGIVGWMSWRVYAGLPLMLVPMGYFGLFAAVEMYRLRRHVARQANPAETGVLDTLRFHRRQLERQRDFRRESWRWSLPAVLGGVALQVAAMAIYSFPWKAIAFVLAVTPLWIAFAMWLGESRARRAQREIDALDSLAGGS